MDKSDTMKFSNYQDLEVVEKTTGYWKDGKLNGHACIWKQDGYLFDGMFSNGKKHGFGSETSGKGNYKAGFWVDGALSSNSMMH